MSKLSELLQQHRHRWRDQVNPLHRLSQEEVSIQLGYSESTYGQWERGRSQPHDRRDIVQLIGIFYEGRSVENLAEANNLLQAGGYHALSPPEIRQIAAAWLPLPEQNEDGALLDKTQQAGNHTDDPAITYVYQRFPTEIFCRYINYGHEIRILNTWIPNLDHFIELFITALQQDVHLRILLLYPRSFIAELRNEALEVSPHPLLRESVQRGVDDNLTVLQYIARHLNERQRKQLQVRLYHSLPSVSIYQVDQFCLMGIYFHGHLAINSPQSEVNMNSFFGKRLDGEFNTLWSIGQPIQDLENWRLELDLLAGKF